MNKISSFFFALLLIPLIGCASNKQTSERKTSTAKMTGEKGIALPAPDLKGKLSLEETLAQRRSVRSYTSEELTIKQVSQLLWAGQGITAAWGGRTAPSAGALYPMELYLAKKDGVWHYLPDGHRLKKVRDGDVRANLSLAALGQSSVGDAPLVVIITGVHERTSIKYGDRAERYVKIEAGHVCQNILLQAVALDLGGIPIGAFNDTAVQKVLGIPSDHQPLYLVPVGHPAE